MIGNDLLADSVTIGAGSVVYGVVKPLCWFVIFWAAAASPEMKGVWKWFMAAGAFANGVVAIIFLPVSAEWTPFGAGSTARLVDVGEVIAAPAMVFFTLGFLAAAVHLAGLNFGRPDR